MCRVLTEIGDPGVGFCKRGCGSGHRSHASSGRCPGQSSSAKRADVSAKFRYAVISFEDQNASVHDSVSEARKLEFEVQSQVCGDFILIIYNATHKCSVCLR